MAGKAPGWRHDSTHSHLARLETGLGRDWHGRLETGGQVDPTSQSAEILPDDDVGGEQTDCGTDSLRVAIIRILPGSVVRSRQFLASK